MRIDTASLMWRGHCLSAFDLLFALRPVSLVRQFPGLRVFPRNVDRVIEVQQQPFASVEKSKPENDSCRKTWPPGAGRC